MYNPQIEIQIVDNSLQDNHYWKKLISMFAMVGLKFEIHCWNEETEEIKTALKFGKEKSTDWEFGTIIEGVIDEKFIEMIHHTVKPLDIGIYNKMTPFFSIFFENGFSSEHYGTEFHILSPPMNDADFTVLLKNLQEYAIINEF
jgi:hypothetical protein